MHEMTKDQEEKALEALEKAIKYFGSAVKLAKRLTQAGYQCRQQTITGWFSRRRIPLLRAIQIEEITEKHVLKQDFRPDIFVI